MTNNNNFYELPKTATVAYYDAESDQNLTPKEWNKLCQNNSNELETINKVSDVYISEKAFNKDVATYGPGKTEEKFRDGWGIGLAAITYLCPPAGAIVSGATAGAGAITGVIGKISGNDDMAQFGWDMTVVGATAGLGAAAGSQGHKSSNCKISSVCPK
ncbi:MAG: hypothetical protein GBAus27B_000551 [Mycoplasmataceae bacterium]|nr:MAG: hypothetical protein GBAus27B_000551 [Mycoplasmataceae bacterium]